MRTLNSAKAEERRILELGKLGSGELVVDRHRSHMHSLAPELLARALARVNSQGRTFILEVIDFEVVVGNSNLVETKKGDEIIFAQRPNRLGLTRFVKNRKPMPCSTVVVILKAADNRNGAYVLQAAFIGPRPEHEPWDAHATEKSREFWSSHALVWGSERIIPGTETRE